VWLIIDNAGPLSRRRDRPYETVFELITRVLLLGMFAAVFSALLYIAYLAAVIGILPVPQLAGVSADSAGRLAGYEAEAPNFATVLEASTVVAGPAGERDIGISAVAFNHFVASSGRAAPQLEWARAHIDGAEISIEGELRGHIYVAFAGRATANAADGVMRLQLAIERFGILPLPGFLSQVRQWTVEVPATPYIVNLLGLDGTPSVG
jgi:hypothetical protein